MFAYPQKVNSTTSLFTAAVGIKQKETVDKMVRKVIHFSASLLKLSFNVTFNKLFVIMQFLSSDFSVMLFHYDGVVDAWKDLEWANNVVHVSAVNQTKW